MGCRILHDVENRSACMYDSVTGTAFGPVFRDCSEAGVDARDCCEAFQQWLETVDLEDVFKNSTYNNYRRDPRSFEHSELQAIYAYYVEGPHYPSDDYHFVHSVSYGDDDKNLQRAERHAGE